ncbi:MAG: hypothetical protein KAI55_04110, partial [Candidatus Aenigmarchaeota archaeon]|nr:hypothetical protein [Candidatus Aenigmarchaeota archaeon]
RIIWDFDYINNMVRQYNLNNNIDDIYQSFGKLVFYWFMIIVLIYIANILTKDQFLISNNSSWFVSFVIVTFFEFCKKKE